VTNDGPAAAPAGQSLTFTATGTVTVLCHASTTVRLAPGEVANVECGLPDEIGTLIGSPLGLGRIHVELADDGPPPACGAISGSSQDGLVWLHCE
jgi:hypothetical protein